ncbi:hypothetical protein Hanom_Chr02g00167921 [Helianthus anomalus]
MTEMNGRLCSTRPMRIGPAANKENVGGQQYPNGTCCCFYSLSQFRLLILSAWVLNLCLIRLVPCEMILV